ncbi:hypothetical protein [Nitrospira moscoviensis]|uniref:Lipoprotein n=1 Tax=Nitrospira moscoviensis TaxID=42253 RepID=A0A0K2G810_NITMO|nr:hypothetical protein [Nitrospira moscoviensis]ALA56989.1 conserved exported protein of unknown function [Nitrospira moscoviensis]
MRRLLTPLAIGMAALYLALALGAAGCLLSHSQEGALPHHPHQSHVGHSAFCAWACQANPAVGLPVPAPPAVVLQLVALMVVVRSSMVARVAARAFRSRAPPR